MTTHIFYLYNSKIAKMNLFKMSGKSARMLLMSLALNVILVSLFCVLESRKHVVEKILQARGIIEAPLDCELPDYNARRGWENTIEKLYHDFDVAFLGNSITCQSDFQAAFPQISIINLGYPGDNLKGMKRRVPMLQKSHPKKIFIMAGTNDLIVNDITTYRDEYFQLVKAIKNSIPESEIFLQSVLPSNHGFNSKFKYASNNKVKLANKIVEEIADSMDCHYVNLFDLYVGSDGELPAELTIDGVHLTSDAYNRWVDAIKPLICDQAEV